MANMAGNSGKLGILYSQSYAIEHGSGWDDGKEHLVQLEEVDNEFLKLRAQNCEMWAGEQPHNYANAKLVASRLSTHFTPSIIKMGAWKFTQGCRDM